MPNTSAAVDTFRDIRKLVSSLVLLLIATIPIPSEAQWYDPQIRKPLPDTDSRKRSGDLGLLLAVAENPEAFLDEWHNTSREHTPRLRIADKVQRGAVVAALVFFSRCGVEGGRCNLLLDFKVLKPDGSVYGASADNRMWSGPVQHKDAVQLSENVLKIRIEQRDPFGVYPVLVKVRDPDSRKEIHLRSQFEVVP